MRRFSSYGPVDTAQHYYVPRKTLIEKTYTQLLGPNPQRGGYYFTVWAPRQTGKTWVMQQILFQLQDDDRFDVLKINLEHLKYEKNTAVILETIAGEIGEGLDIELTGINTQAKFQGIFKKSNLNKPLILILDEFDALGKKGINTIVSAFRNIYINRLDQVNKPVEQKNYLLHGVALIGVRSVLGIENETGSPFNVQRSLHIPNLAYDEVVEMFQWYQKESGQEIHQKVIDSLYEDTNGQPGLTSWFGELLTETYNEEKNRPITMDHFERVQESAINLLPNANIINIIEKANQVPHKDLVLKIFRTDKLFGFRFDDKSTNFLYMNGVIEPVETGKKNFIKFAGPFVQKRLFNYFSHELFGDMDRLTDPMDTLEDAITVENLNIKSIIKRYRQYLEKNKHWLFKDAPRRKDMRIFEAVFHFNFYMYLYELIENRGGRVYPEFPTGNGKIDIIIKYHDNMYGLELKTFSDTRSHQEALEKAAQYGKKLGLNEINLVSFIESIDNENKKKLETLYRDKTSGVTVIPILVETGT
ncbi:MAG: AAA family ATPase [bacterium]|nr:AAA family ATPase [bacterium]